MIPLRSCLARRLTRVRVGAKISGDGLVGGIGPPALEPFDERAGMLVKAPRAVIAALVLVAAVASGCSGPGLGPRDGAAARNASPPPKVTLSAPAALGSWKQATDQSSARALVAVFTDATNAFAVRYEQPGKPPRTLIVLGATAARFHPGDATIQQDAFYTALNSSSAPVAPRPRPGSAAISAASRRARTRTPWAPGTPPAPGSAPAS
ncbi:hypothetical protein [Dactylosporangium sp. CA-139066]|uniref:hypothetical protein n=1 Tax=Dactylosporangium sp. CA-139066 TaxID=3239930 RepID=UPI003D931D50